VRCALAALTALLAATPGRDGAPDGGATPAAGERLRVPLGVTYSGWRGGFAQAPARLQRYTTLGFPMVSFVPAYTYVDLDRIDLTSGPTWQELGAAVEAALRARLLVVIKPHLDPAAFQPGFDPLTAESSSWRISCPWRGFFDVDPMTADYREGIVLGALRMLAEVMGRMGEPRPAPVRLELGVELMSSVVAHPQRWEQLLAAARRERHRLGLDGRVLLSHNFTHHLEIPGDFVDRMDAAGRRALGRYIKGLDAVALSQYMDLTVAVPPAERRSRLPTADEVAQALVRHEADFRRGILEQRLGLRPAEIPPLHIGEFGIGRGGLRHPNLYEGRATPEQEAALAREITRGHEGFLRYLSLDRGRTARSAVLWVTGTHYDVFGWGSPSYGVPPAAAAIRAALAASRQ
jgi:hypothetical protein